MWCLMTVPQGISEYQLNKVGVEVVGSESLTLRCGKCRETWAVKQKGLSCRKAIGGALTGATRAGKEGRQ